WERRQTPCAGALWEWPPWPAPWHRGRAAQSPYLRRAGRFSARAPFVRSTSLLISFQANCSCGSRLRRRGFPAGFAERHAVDDSVDQRLELVIRIRKLFIEICQHAAVIGFETAAERVGEHFLRQRIGELRERGGERGAHFGGRGEGGSVGKDAARIDGEGAILRAPFTDAVVVFEAEAEGV